MTLSSISSPPDINSLPVLINRGSDVCQRASNECAWQKFALSTVERADNDVLVLLVVHRVDTNHKLFQRGLRGLCVLFVVAVADCVDV
jgi:hypothetical protein